MKIVIMAGGKGTRIAEVNSQVPKPMIPIDGKPILEYQIKTLKKQNIWVYGMEADGSPYDKTDYFNYRTYGPCNQGLFRGRFAGRGKN